MACLACSRVDSSEKPAERARAVSAAKIRIADAARHVSQEAVQLHGGMGMSDELKVSHAFRRLTVLAREFGDADHHLARFAPAAEVVELRGAQALARDIGAVGTQRERQGEAAGAARRVAVGRGHAGQRSARLARRRRRHGGLR